MEWNDETIARLRALWAEGHSTAEIGRRMGVSKNAVVGKAHRLNLSARPSPIRRDANAAGARAPTPRRVTGPTLPPMDQAQAHVGTAPSPTDQGEEPVAAMTAAQSDSSRPDASQPDPGRSDASLSDSLPSVSAGPVPAGKVREAVRPAAPVSERVALAPVRAVQPRPSRTVSCCWPIGEPGTKSFRFCDAAAAGGKPYCGEHAAVAYVKVRDRRDEAA